MAFDSDHIEAKLCPPSSLPVTAPRDFGKMESLSDFKSMQEHIQKGLVSTVKQTNRVAAEDLSFHRTVNPDVAEKLDESTKRILDLSARLLSSAAKACNVKVPKLDDVDDIDMNWRGVVDVVDTVLEKADTALDEYTGLIKRKEPPTADSGSQSKKPKSSAKVIRHANITKPQVHFDLKPNNFPEGPWKPLLTKKPHAKVPLEDSHDRIPGELGKPQYKHPYETEILQMKYPTRIYKEAEPIMYQPVDTTSATWVDTYDGVLDMLKDLKKAKEIAVDLEHHDYRSYVGLVSLMQVSTREKDWIVDTLQPWRHKLEVLNEVFADPKIVKVFHGAYMDIVWLQRDLGLYVNGLFDTYFACELLYPGKSLAYLLSRFVNFDADKQYQLADWRIRPLPDEMMYYARSDTHYLLYIYDNVRNDLVSQSSRDNSNTNYIERALQKSRELALTRYEHQDYDEDTGQGPRGWNNYLLRKSHTPLSSEQFAVFKALWKWRDDTARKEDESSQYVLPQPHILEIAKFNPQDAKALHSLLPMNSPLARSRVNEIWNLIREMKAQGGPTLLQFFSSMTDDTRGNNGLLWQDQMTAPLLSLKGDVSAKRLPQSQLFGNMPISSRWDEAKKVAGAMNDQIPFPWQKFIQQDGMEYTNGEPTSAEAVPAQAPAPDLEGPLEHLNMADADEEFTLKKTKKRRASSPPRESDSSSSGSEFSVVEKETNKPQDVDMADPVGENGVITITEPEENLNSGARRKLRRQAAKEKKTAEMTELQIARKARREEKKRRKAETREAQPKQEETGVPFDYSKATSVMHAKRNGTSEATDNNAKGKGKKVFNPYAKTMEEEGIKGARKAPPVRGERSATFKK